MAAILCRNFIAACCVSPTVVAVISYPSFIRPEVFRIGPLRPRWYGIMYLAAFLIGRQVLRWLCRTNYLRLAQEKVDDLLVWFFVGMLVGARLVYMLVYYQPAPGETMHWYSYLQVWNGGLAFHGGALGMLIGGAWFARRQKISFWNISDSLALAAPIGLFLGRLGNFINAELFGRETNVPWAMSFPIREGDQIVGWTSPRHPSQIYEAIGEGLLLLAIVWFMRCRLRVQGLLTGLAISSYGIIRFVLEFFREKDEQMRYYFGWMTMGQILCGLMVFLGIAVWIAALRTGQPVTGCGATPDVLRPEVGSETNASPL